MIGLILRFDLIDVSNESIWQADSTGCATGSRQMQAPIAAFATSRVHIVVVGTVWTAWYLCAYPRWVEVIAPCALGAGTLLPEVAMRIIGIRRSVFWGCHASRSRNDWSWPARCTRPISVKGRTQIASEGADIVGVDIVSRETFSTNMAVVGLALIIWSNTFISWNFISSKTSRTSEGAGITLTERI